MSNDKPKAQENGGRAAKRATAGPAATQAARAGVGLANDNRWSTREMAVMALMCAIAVVLSFIEIPIIPGVTFLKYDASIVPALVCGLAYSGGVGVTVGVVCALVHGMFTGNWVGAVMNILVVLAMVAPAAALYRRRHTFRGAVVALVAGSVVAIVVACVSNLVIDPLFYGIPLPAVQALIVPALIPFNIVKAAANSLLTMLVYKSISNMITPKKSQVKGK